MIFKYRAAEKKHIKQVQKWLDASEYKGDLSSFNGSANVKEYVEEYSDRFGIAAHLASDLGMPKKEVNEMWKEYRKYSKLEGVVFGN